MAAVGLWEPMAVRAQTIKTAVEAACLLLRVDDILSGGMPKQQQQQGGPAQPHPEDGPMGEE
jgi:T-complex protein 1 subunit gamma